MESKLLVEIDSTLKKEAQLYALENDITLKEVTAKALEEFLQRYTDTEKE